VLFALLVLVQAQVQSQTELEAQIYTHEDPYFPIYGVYCGLYHTSYYGKEPIDEQDRYCQYHDICVTLETQGLSSCWCNEQLYFLTSNLKPKNEELSGIKDSILYYLYIAMARCNNYYHFDTNFKITKVKDSEDKKGFNYLPFYPLHENKIQSYMTHINKTDSNRTIGQYLALVYQMDVNIYQQFTKDVYDDPKNSLGKYAEYVITILSTKPFIFNMTNDDKVVVIYNPSNKYDQTIHVEEVKLCNSQSTHHNTYDVTNNSASKNIKEMSAMKYGLIIMSVIIVILMVSLIAIISKYKKLTTGDYHLVLPP
jgi:hypothetical protein